MRIDIQAGPWLMAVAWFLVTLAAASLAYGFARVAEHSLAHLGEERAMVGEYWGWSDVGFGIAVAVLIAFAAIFPAETAVRWLGKALGK